MRVCLYIKRLYDLRVVNIMLWLLLYIVVVQSLSCVWLCVTPWIAAHQASLSFTISQSLLKLMSIESVMPSNHLVLCHPLLLLPSIFLSIRVFSNPSSLCIRWLEYWSFSFSISPSNKYLWLSANIFSFIKHKSVCVVFVCVMWSSIFWLLDLSHTVRMFTEGRTSLCEAL